MELKDKMMDLGLTERELQFNKEYYIEYFTFNRKIAIDALCYLIDNSKEIIKIYHKVISLNEENLKSNKVIKALRNNTETNIEYYTKVNSTEEEKIKTNIGKHVKVKKVEIGSKNYHHKEMEIDNKYLIITSLNFLTNNLIDDINHRNFWLENFSIWVKRSVK